LATTKSSFGQAGASPASENHSVMVYLWDLQELNMFRFLGYASASWILMFFQSCFIFVNAFLKKLQKSDDTLLVCFLVKDEPDHLSTLDF
jgi:hypothetical protein